MQDKEDRDPAVEALLKELAPGGRKRLLDPIDRNSDILFGWGRYGGVTPWLSGLVMVILGVIVEAIVIALGG